MRRHQMLKKNMADALFDGSVAACQIRALNRNCVSFYRGKWRLGSELPIVSRRGY